MKGVNEMSGWKVRPDGRDVRTEGTSEWKGLLNGRSPFNPRIRLMGTFRTKEDDVAKISITVYVTNFPESLSAKELFNSCKVYGHVV
ncbi:RNA-directed DNA polymerase, eukaryota, partial [Tanacetum coccineum]